MDNQIINLEVLTKGLLPIEAFLEFCVYEYSYIFRSMTGVHQSKYDVDPIETREVFASCSISTENNVLSVSLEGLNIDADPYYPTHFGTALDGSFPKISGNDDDEFRMLIIPFRDMDKYNQDAHFRMELLFFQGTLDTIKFSISRSDMATLTYSESILELRGKAQMSVSI